MKIETNNAHYSYELFRYLVGINFYSHLGVGHSIYYYIFFNPDSTWKLIFNAIQRISYYVYYAVWTYIKYDTNIELKRVSVHVSCKNNTALKIMTNKSYYIIYNGVRYFNKFTKFVVKREILIQNSRRDSVIIIIIFMFAFIDEYSHALL